MNRKPRRGRAAVRQEARRRAHDVLELRVDDAYPGLEVRARAVPRRTIERLATRAFGDELTGDEHAKAVGDLVDEFARQLVSWNLEERVGDVQVPAPTTPPEAVLLQDKMMVLHLAIVWGRAAMAHAGMTPRRVE